MKDKVARVGLSTLEERADQLERQMSVLSERIRVVKADGENMASRLGEHLFIYRQEQEEGRDADHEYRALRPEYV